MTDKKHYKYALVGNDISYTRSPEIHKAIADVIGINVGFEVADVPADGFERCVERLIATCDGFFVTKPYKLSVKRFLSEARTGGGINVVDCKSRVGYNTDGIGFIRAVDSNLPDWRNKVKSALVLGSGGAAYSVAEALVKAGKRVYVLNRTLMNAAKLCAAVGAELYVNQPAELVVNCTSLGANGEDALSALCVLPDFEYAYDLAYVRRTAFLNRCERTGARVCDGLPMLVYQAIEGVKLITNVDVDVEEVYKGVREILKN